VKQRKITEGGRVGEKVKNHWSIVTWLRFVSRYIDGYYHCEL